MNNMSNTNKGKGTKGKGIKTLPLLVAIREVSRAAHRWRDASQRQYQVGNYGLARYSSHQKRHFYALKERGIVEGYRQGLLRYVGQSPQGLAVYEYGEGGMACFHSRLHPIGTRSSLVPDHPETLFVTAKHATRHVADAEATLRDLPTTMDGFYSIEITTSTSSYYHEEPVCY